MKYFFLILISISPFSYCVELKVATYNIWNPRCEEKHTGKNTWKERLPFIVDSILSADPDVICLQEVNQNCYFDIGNRLSSRYLSLYSPHGEVEGKDGLALFIKAENIHLENLTISKDSERPTHRRDFYADCSLESIKFRIASTHLASHKQLWEKGHQQLEKLINDVLKEETLSGIDFVIVCGDFNESETEPIRLRAEIMLKNGFIFDGSFESTRPEGSDVGHRGRLDWIYFKNLTNHQIELKPVDPIGDEKASDHKLSMTKFVIH